VLYSKTEVCAVAKREIASYKRDKQIDTLARLKDPKEDKKALQKEVEEIAKLEKVYKQAICDILDREGISYK
jgi:hypothetical protein